MPGLVSVTGSHSGPAVSGILWSVDTPSPTPAANDARRPRPDFVYAILLFAAAITALAIAGADAGLLVHGHGWGQVAFFLAFGLFTIVAGFPHPVFGHVSFDRVAQVMSILVLGPVDAAWVNGLASFVYPWGRLRRGVALPAVVTAACHNAGLMVFVILGSGLLYEQLGGPVPIGSLDVDTLLLLVALAIAMQFVNDIGMMFVVWLRRGDPLLVFNRFTAVVEFVSAAGGVVLAIAYTSQSMTFFVLLLLVFVAGMLVIMQYALMRYRLERLVDERTEELRVQAQEFERQATHDKLTGLPNRRYADDYLQQQISLAQRVARNGALALADIDHFKHINDNHSHEVGDRVLARVARILAEDCRNTDFVARYGGEEFLLFFPDTDIGSAFDVCTQLRVAIERTDWSDVAPDFGVTISFGLAEIADGARRRTLLNEADKRLYRAKRDGRNRVVAD